MNTLPDKVAVLTGGSGSIGMATAKRFLEAGARVALVDINQHALDEALQQLRAGRKAIAVKADVTNE